VSFFTFMIVAFFIYGIFARKNQPPVRRPRDAEDQLPRQAPAAAPRRPAGPSRQVRPTRGNVLTNLERQLREAAKPAAFPADQDRNDSGEPVPAAPTSPMAGYVQTEGVGDAEGTWGTEGREYAPRPDNLSVIEQSGIGVKDYAQGQGAGSLVFASSDIVQGIIWAEVLRTPRGKRPYSRK
jgi:hypothetical protein